MLLPTPGHTPGQLVYSFEYRGETLIFSGDETCDIGEDTFVRSPGGYAANVEAVTTVVPDADS